ncbi:hypothetical protein ACNKHN_21965 [Shigella flexneri]
MPRFCHGLQLCWLERCALEMGYNHDSNGRRPDFPPAGTAFIPA